MHNYKSPWKYGVHKYCDKYHAACELAKSSISKEVGMWEESRIRIPENNFVHSHKSYKSQILWQESGAVQISSQRGLSPCELSKSGSFGDSGGMQQRPESRFLAFHVSAPSHPPLNLLSLSVRGWISKGSIATGSKFLQLMDLCLRISHLNLLQIYLGTANYVSL